MALELCFTFWQAQRSVHFAATMLVDCWQDFRAYYDEARQQQISNLMATLPSADAAHKAVQPSFITPRSNLSTRLYRLANALFNKYSTTWTFYAHDLAYARTMLEHLLRLAQTEQDTRPDRIGLASYRLECYLFYYYLETRLSGLAIMKKASQVEHFCHSNHLVFVSINELLDEDQFGR